MDPTDWAVTVVPGQPRDPTAGTWPARVVLPGIPLAGRATERELAETTPPSSLALPISCSICDSDSLNSSIKETPQEKRAIKITTKRSKHPKEGGRRKRGREDATLTPHSRRHSPRQEMQAQPHFPHPANARRPGQRREVSKREEE